MSVHIGQGRKKKSLLRRIVDSHILSAGLVIAGLTTFFVAGKKYSPEKDRSDYAVGNQENREKRQNLNFCAIALLYAGIINAGRVEICKEHSKTYSLSE